MGNTFSFSSDRLQGAVTYSPGSDFAFQTSYAFDPSNTNAFGVPATFTIDGAAPTAPIIPAITYPAAPDGVPEVVTCNTFPLGVTEGSLLCPSATNTDIRPGTLSLNFVAGDEGTNGYLTAGYAISVVTLSTVGGGGGGSGPGATTTKTVTSPATTTTVPGDCSSGSTGPSGSASGSGTGSGTGTGISSRPSGPTGSVRPSSNSTLSPSTGATNSPSGSSGGTGISSSVPPSGSLSAGSSSVPGNGSYVPSVTYGSSGSQIPTITNPSISTTSTSTHIITTTITTVITTYVPCSTPVSTHGGSTIYATSVTASAITTTVTSVITETTVICPATAAANPSSNKGGAEGQSPPQTTLIFTKTVYVCPTPPPTSCPTAAAKAKRDAGFDGPDYTLSNGDKGPVITDNGATRTVTSTTYLSTITETQGCGSTGLSEEVRRRARDRVRRS